MIAFLTRNFYASALLLFSSLLFFHHSVQEYLFERLSGWLSEFISSLFSFSWYVSFGCLVVFFFFFLRVVAKFYMIVYDKVD